MKQSNLDSWLLVREKVTCIVYIEGLIFWDMNQYDIHKLSMYLQELGVDLEQEDDAKGLSGMNFGRERRKVLIDMKKMD